MFGEIFKNVKRKHPLVHLITNYVTVNDCANILLAAGASPIMADDIAEVEEITSLCTALVINMGTLNERTIKSMFAAGKKANALSLPVILDPVGVGASMLRTDTALNLLKEVRFSVIRGNISEIRFLARGGGNVQGVDAAVADMVTDRNIDEVVSFSKEFSRKTSSVIAISGRIDVVADEKNAYLIKNGHALMPKVTGTGCMSTALLGGFCGANHDNYLNATAMSVASIGLAGELAHKKLCELGAGVGTYRTLLIDYMEKMDVALLKEGGKIECR